MRKTDSTHKKQTKHENHRKQTTTAIAITGAPAKKFTIKSAEKAVKSTHAHTLSRRQTRTYTYRHAHKEG